MWGAMNREELLQHAEKCERLADLRQREHVQRALRLAAGVCRRLAVTSATGNSAGPRGNSGVDTKH
jgi:hypothetical protein